MKSKWMLPGTLVCALVIPTLAQDSPKVEITGDYSYVRFNPTLPRAQNKSFNGGGFDASFFLRPALGVKADLQFYGSTTFTTTFATTVTSAGIIPAGTYSSNGSLKTYLFGPIVKGRMKHFEPFGQILFGVAHVDAYANLSRVIAGTPGATLHVQGNQNPFAMAVGGGVDLPLSHAIAVRLADVDYLLTRLTNPLTSTNNQNNFRYAGGIQFRLGGSK
jgi:opacity protein-like surface antigen